jgi:hypothetical protein
MSNMIGIYDDNVDPMYGWLGRLGSPSVGFSKNSIYCMGIYPITKVRDILKDTKLNYILFSGVNWFNNIEILKSFNNVIWMDSCRFHRYCAVREPVYFFSVNGDAENSNPIYSNKIPSDRRKLFNINPEIYLNNGSYVLIAHDHGSCPTRNEKFKFFESVIQHCVNNKIKFKLCFHPTIKSCPSVKEDFINRYNKLGNIEYCDSTYDNFDKSRCVISWGGRVVIECLIKGIPIYTGNNIHTKDILKINSFENFIDNPIIPSIEEREIWFNWLCYTHWSNSELSDGIAQSTLLELWGNKCYNE